MERTNASKAMVIGRPQTLRKDSCRRSGCSRQRIRSRAASRKLRTPSDEGMPVGQARNCGNSCGECARLACCICLHVAEARSKAGKGRLPSTAESNSGGRSVINSASAISRHSNACELRGATMPPVTAMDGAREAEPPAGLTRSRKRGRSLADRDGFSLSPTKMGLTPPLEVGVEETDII
eukprot:scaffold9411_cov129-Isochrysis_galbana.AAC.2